MKPTIAISIALIALLLSGARFSLPATAQDATPAPAAAAATPALKVLRPVANAVVRETVPVRIAPSDLPADGYVGITIDDVFRTARVLPDTKSGVVYEWDTKAAYTTPDDPDTPKYTSDGDHTIKIDLYDHSGTLLGEAVIPVRVANKIIVPAQGIKLAYHWTADQQLRYLHQTELNIVPSNDSGGGLPGAGTQNIQASLVHFIRSVEDTSGGNYLVRDSVLPNSYLIDHGQTQAVQAAYNIKSLYRTVDARGNVLREMAALSPGQHIGYSIPVMPARKVAVGDSWQSPVEMTLSWAPLAPATVNAESRLEGFEWQNGYPTAKIRETYTGPATFGTVTTPTTTPVAAFGGPSAAAPAVNPLAGSFQNVKYERVIYFAYNSGRLVRTETTLDVEDTLTPDRISALGIGSSGVSGPSGGQGPYAGLLAGDSGNDQPQPPPPSPYAGNMQQPGGYQGGGYPGGGYPGGGYPGGGYPGGGYPGGGYQGQVAAPPTPVHLRATDITTLLT